ncbi:MAG: D-isomer specific 2-hydroxyacid dehydrogenase [Parcubacteria group bacterium Gr01-1014_48]|nr:MAG: D-isomer specific 2-hydroxyacid dehydrogenase [Parcubacteria group bacterium Greene0416_14]TSC74071.1 MAG: D-isomer specific 2-hydroxyacid dehydrogenase [Parcubacteria group bacterium Gr01-1014_48]TSD01142.1 MAG: D-isomer specific 2-hydroxyacid dehydrogenase [Parcubacteria group bacterium Greene1014_15]TSD08218.1 MAG: D-isomer specific 2-hydroxyacid dehydrogenase [Parcubacteria group bacterium Greene0714_4]
MKVYVTREIPESGTAFLREKGYEVTVSEKNGVLTKSELVLALTEKEYDAVLCLLTDTIDADVFHAAPKAKIFANYAVGVNNVDVKEAAQRGILITNTPDVLTDTVAEHTFGLILAITARIAEGDRFTRAGKYVGWAPMLLLGCDLRGKTLGVLGAGRIGSRVAHHARNGFDMDVIYYDVQKNDLFEKEYNATYFSTAEEVLQMADIVTVHVPLLDATRHLINSKRLAMMKPTSYLVNTSRGPVIDETALVAALRTNIIRGAALDVFENEPALAPGLVELENVVLTPHIASATEETRAKMAVMAAENIIAVFEGRTPPNLVKN